MMNYTKTKHKNIYRAGNSYRVRKYVNGERMSAYFPTVKACKEWLAMMSK